LLAHLHERAIGDTKLELKNLALVLARYTENSLQSIELLEDGVVDEVNSLGIATTEQFNERLTGHATHRDLQARIAALPDVEALFLTNAVGQTIASTRAWPQAVFSIADRPHFAVIRDNPKILSYLAPPAQNFQTGTWNLYLTRRISAADGRFLGVVGAGIGLARMEAFLARLALAPVSAIAIWRRDGVLLARYPEAAATVGRQAASGSLIFQEVLANSDSGTAEGISAVDGYTRIIAAQALVNYPVAVTVSRTKADVLALWRRQAVFTACALLLIAGSLISFVVLGIRHLASRDLLEKARLAVNVLEEQRRNEAKISHLAHHDALTGLANRTLLQRKLNQAITRVKNDNTFAVLCLDLDHFKDVNDTLGHATGDALLQAVTERLQAQTRTGDTIARLGGDEFAILQEGLGQQPGDTAKLAQRLVEALAAPFDMEGHHIIIGTSIGIAVAPGDGCNTSELLKSADLALYRAKSDGRGCFRFFEPEMNAHAQMRRTLLSDLRRAIHANEFELFYQPKVDIKSRVITGYEALLRWRHPDQGLIMPDRFIALAEETGLIVPLGEWVLNRACLDAALRPGPTKISVNLSPVQFTSSELVAAVVSALQASGLDVNRLELEITETALLRDTEATLTMLHRLRTLGISIALDDFGTGYSSLSYLQRFPFDRVKIDKSFVQSLGKRKESDAIVRSVIALCRALDMETTAEGVETEEQCQILAAIRCNEAQGYLFGRPQPASSQSESMTREHAP
jgi:diguanylate cyclase (GGDEF)-like protein